MDYRTASSLATLHTRLEQVNDWLVDAENEITPDGDHPTFTALHADLEHMLQLVVDLENEE
jgi:hypothetical protein